MPRAFPFKKQVDFATGTNPYKIDYLGNSYRSSLYHVTVSTDLGPIQIRVKIHNETAICDLGEKVITSGDLRNFEWNGELPIIRGDSYMQIIVDNHTGSTGTLTINGVIG